MIKNHMITTKVISKYLYRKLGVRFVKPGLSHIIIRPSIISSFKSLISVAKMEKSTKDLE